MHHELTGYYVGCPENFQFFACKIVLNGQMFFTWHKPAKRDVMMHRASTSCGRKFYGDFNTVFLLCLSCCLLLV